MILTYTATPSVDSASGVISIAEEFGRSLGLDGTRERFYRQVVSTRDEAVRRALIALGWTPPTEQPSAASARAAGESAADRCTAAAERRGFDSKAAAKAMLEYLEATPTASSEDLVDAAKRAGHVPHDDRSFGSIIAKLARDRKIRQVDTCVRRRGNGTAGGRIWERCLDFD